MQNVAFLDGEFHVDDIKERFSAAEAFGAPLALRAFHMVARLCNAAKFDSASAQLPLDERQIKGDATDTAVLRFSESLPNMDCAQLISAHEKVFEIPFNSRNKWMMTIQRERAGSDEDGDGQVNAEERTKESAEWANAILRGVWPIMNPDL